jgi:hypothetical protein
VPEELRTLQSEIERIRSEIKGSGESIVACEELRVLCEEEVPVSDQWNALAKIAINEKWSFTFFPNGSVRFANLVSK